MFFLSVILIDKINRTKNNFFFSFLLFFSFDEADADTISEDQTVIISAKNMMRRGSKSLPASPLGSPKLLRKASPNPYFTGAFAVGPPTTEQR